MKRWIFIAGGVLTALVLLVVLILFFVVSSLDSIIKAAVEKYGSEVTQVEVRLDKAKVSITSGEGSLRGLTVGNPKGFKTNRAFSLGEISIVLDVGTVTQNPIVIKEIVISAPEVTYELSSGGSNIDVIQRNVNAYTGTAKGKAKVKDPSKDPDKEGRKLIIQHLYVKKGKVNVSATMLKGKELSAALPDIHLKDIGKQKGGADPSEVVEKLVMAISQSAGKAVGTLDLDRIVGSVKDAVAGMKGQLEGVKGSADSAKQAAEECAKKLGGAFKKLFGD
ncbi:MAG: hypothetical protein V3U06_08985 [Candidatus Binatia bacterium]